MFSQQVVAVAPPVSLSLAACAARQCYACVQIFHCSRTFFLFLAENRLPLTQKKSDRNSVSPKLFRHFYAILLIVRIILFDL